MSNPKRLHPVALVLGLLRQLRELAIPFIVFLFIGRENNEFTGWYALAIVGLLVLSLIIGALKWFFFTYRVEEGELRIEQGVFVKKRRYIPMERIQSIDFSQGVVQRLFGLVKIQIETAGGGDEPEAVLSAVTKDDGETLRHQLTEKKSADKELDDQEEPGKQAIMKKLSRKDLLIAASTSSGIGVALSFVAAFGSQIDNFIPDAFFITLTEQLIQSSIALIVSVVLIVLFVSWVLSITGVLLQYGRFTLVRSGSDLIIERGLLERRQLTIPVNRIQAVRMVEGLFRQPFGYAALHVESGGGGGKEEKFSTVLFPIMRKKNVASFLAEVVPEFHSTLEVNALPSRSVWRYIIRVLLPVAIIVVPVMIFVPYGKLSLVLLGGAVLVGYLRYKDAGWNINGSFLTLQFRKFGRVTVLTPRRRIQSSIIKMSYFQKRKRLASYQISILSSLSGRHFMVQDMDEDVCAAIFGWYSKPDSFPRNKDEHIKNDR
ncbi:PH domain-containing protein [Pseudalkalibacillus caeni]|nr:PH domain-containing protein [Pseudalkalibacillus caeni]